MSVISKLKELLKKIKLPNFKALFAKRKSVAEKEAPKEASSDEAELEAMVAEEMAAEKEEEPEPEPITINKEMNHLKSDIDGSEIIFEQETDSEDGHQTLKIEAAQIDLVVGWLEDAKLQIRGVDSPDAAPVEEG